VKLVFQCQFSQAKGMKFVFVIPAKAGIYASSINNIKTKLEKASFINALNLNQALF
jgi:hypothetical protein